MTTISSQIYSLIQKIELALQKNFSGPQIIRIRSVVSEQVLSLRILIYYTPPTS